MIRSALIFFLFIFTGYVAAQSEPAKTEEIRNAETTGSYLYKKIISGDGVGQLTSRETGLLKTIEDNGLGCEGTYKAVSIASEKDSEENLFFILFSDLEGIPFGRHFRFRLQAGTDEVIDVTPSSQTCFFVPSSGNDIAYSAHPLSDVPTEFHVFLSLYYKKEIYVSTSLGIWSVREGQITKIE